MTGTTTRRLALPALAIVGALALAAGGSSASDTAAPGSSSAGGHGSGHSTDGGSDTAKGNDADVAFLTGMKPHHEQAVEMSEIVLAADPQAEVAAIAARIKEAQAPEIEQMDTMLTDLGETANGGHGGGHSGGHSGGHGGMLSDADMAALEAAKGNDAARLYLEGMIDHHQGALEASDTEIADGQYAPAIALAQEIRTAQAAEITDMQALLATL